MSDENEIMNNPEQQPQKKTFVAKKLVRTLSKRRSKPTVVAQEVENETTDVDAVIGEDTAELTSEATEVSAEVKTPVADKPVKKSTKKTGSAKSGQSELKPGGKGVKLAAHPPKKKEKPAPEPTPMTEEEEEQDAGLKLLYQTIYSPKEGRVVGYECLLRVYEQSIGELTPSVYLDVAKKYPELIGGLEQWAVGEALRLSEQLFMKDDDIEIISVNICSQHFMEVEFLDRMSDIVKNSGIRPQNVYLEIGEDILGEDDFYVGDTLRALKKLGFRLAIDNFGYEFFSVAGSTIDYPIDLLKIDRSFVLNFLVNKRSMNIVKMAIDFARQNNMKIAAVGVEKKEQEDVLIELGCDLLQGYYYSKPNETSGLTK